MQPKLHTYQQQQEDFTLTGGGLIQQILAKLGLHRNRWKLAILLLCIAWLPLVIITAINGTLWSDRGLSFLRDFTMQGRLLIGIPLMVLIKNGVYRRIPSVLQYVSDVLVRESDREKYIHGILQRAKKRTESTGMEIFLAVLVVAIALNPSKGVTLVADTSSSGSWLVTGEGGNHVLSFAGNWVRYVSIPIFQFLLLSWAWRYLVWVILLYRLSRLTLQLQPTHPDGSGGLGIIMLAHRGFNQLYVVLGMVISSAFIARLAGDDRSFELIRVELTGYIILSIILILLPMFFFSGQLVTTKNQGKFELGKAGMNLSKKFEGGWVEPLRNENRVTENAVDPSMHYDYYGLYILLQDLRILPVKFSEVMFMAMIFFAPFIPIFFIHFSIGDLLEKLINMLV